MAAHNQDIDRFFRLFCNMLKRVVEHAQPRGGEAAVVLGGEVSLDVVGVAVVVEVGADEIDQTVFHKP